MSESLWWSGGTRTRKWNNAIIRTRQYVIIFVIHTHTNIVSDGAVWSAFRTVLRRRVMETFAGRNDDGVVSQSTVTGDDNRRPRRGLSDSN